MNNGNVVDFTQDTNQALIEQLQDENQRWKKLNNELFKWCNTNKGN
jgi:hypothetical protein